MTHSNLSSQRDPAPRITFCDSLSRQQSFQDAVCAGLAQTHKAIPCRFLYDARGSQLFDRICDLPEYYPTRTETALLNRHAHEIADLAGANACLIELGSGSSTKTRILLDALEAPSCYVPIDVSREHLRSAAQTIANDYPDLEVIAISANYAEKTPLPETSARRVAFFPGSTIGNLTRDEAVSLMADWRGRIGPGGSMVIGIDLRKDHALLEAAYDDQAGVTREFITNILQRANRELDADFDRDAFGYEAIYREDVGRVEMNLISLRAQSVNIAGNNFEFARGERVHVENSHKYSLEETRHLAEAAGFTPIANFHGEPPWFTVQVWRA